MGQATLWFLASVADAEALATSDSYSKWPRLELGGILQFELADLYEVLVDGGGYSPKLVRKPHDDIFVTLVPEQFIRALAAITDIPATAARWKATAEHLADWPEQELVSVLTEMRSFAGRAVAAGMTVLDLAVC